MIQQGAGYKPRTPTLELNTLTPQYRGFHIQIEDASGLLLSLLMYQQLSKQYFATGVKIQKLFN